MSSKIFLSTTYAVIVKVISDSQKYDWFLIVNSV